MCAVHTTLTFRHGCVFSIPDLKDEAYQLYDIYTTPRLSLNPHSNVSSPTRFCFFTVECYLCTFPSTGVLLGGWWCGLQRRAALFLELQDDDLLAAGQLPDEDQGAEGAVPLHFGEDQGLPGQAGHMGEATARLCAGFAPDSPILALAPRRQGYLSLSLSLFSCLSSTCYL